MQSTGAERGECVLQYCLGVSPFGTTGFGELGQVMDELC